MLAELATIELLALDEWLLTLSSDPERRDVLEVLEDRSEQSSTLIAPQLPVRSWDEIIGEASIGDAICDRIVHASHHIALKGPSLRDPKSGKTIDAEAAE